MNHDVKSFYITINIRKCFIFIYLMLFGLIHEVGGVMVDAWNCRVLADWFRAMPGESLGSVLGEDT